MVGNALEYAKAHQMENMDLFEYKELLMGVYLSINSWQLPDSNLPDDGSNWGAVYESFRHAFLLYTSRLLSPEQPAEVSIIRESVEAVLDAVSEIPSSLIDLAIFPLFIAGTDTLSLHSRHYILLRLDAIRSIAGFSNDLPKMLLHKVWESRANQPKWDSRNILWTSFVNSPCPKFLPSLILHRRIRRHESLRTITSLSNLNLKTEILRALAFTRPKIIGPNQNPVDVMLLGHGSACRTFLINVTIQPSKQTHPE